MNRKDRAKETISRLIEAFDNGIISQISSIHRIKRNPGDHPPPSAAWSMRNQILMAIAGTIDGRGYRQWQDAGRQVRKGSEAFYILVPCFASRKKKKADATPDMFGEDRPLDDAGDMVYKQHVYEGAG